MQLRRPSKQHLEPGPPFTQRQVEQRAARVGEHVDDDVVGGLVPGLERQPAPRRRSAAAGRRRWSASVLDDELTVEHHNRVQAAQQVGDVRAYRVQSRRCRECRDTRSGWKNAMHR